MKNFIGYVWLFLKLVVDNTYKESINKLFIAPLVIAGIITAATSIGKKIAEDKKAKDLAKKLDAQKAADLKEETRLINQQTNVARGVARQGDPTLAEKQRQIGKSAANVVGKTVASSSSTQEIINAAQTTQANKDTATNTALSQAGEFKLKTKELLASRFGNASAQRLGAKQIINAEAQASLDAIGANAQAGVDSLQNIGGQFIQLAALKGN